MPSARLSKRHTQILENGREKDEDVQEVPSPRISSKPLRGSLEPYQIDYDLPSLTNGSNSTESRTPSVATDCERSNLAMDSPSLEPKFLWSEVDETMPCSNGPQVTPR